MRANTPKYWRCAILGFGITFPINTLSMLTIGVRFTRPPITKCRCRVDNFFDNNIASIETLNRIAMDNQTQFWNGAISLVIGVDGVVLWTNAKTNPFRMYDCVCDIT